MAVGRLMIKTPIFIFCIGLVMLGLYFASLYNYLLFHSLVEIFSIIVACTIFMFAWNLGNTLENHYFLFLGIAYFFIGGLDLVHTLAYTGMNIFPGAKTNLPTQLWIVSRYLESLSLLIAFFFLHRKLNRMLVLVVYLGVTTLLLLAIFTWKIIPVCFVEGTGLTAFKIYSEYLISLLLAGSFILLQKNRSYFDAGVLRLMQSAILFTIGGELAFTFYVSAYGLSNLIGHYLKIFSYYCIYAAVIETGLTKPFKLLFKELNQYKTELESKVQERTSELVKITDDLQQEIIERQQAEENLNWELSVNKILSEVANGLISPSFSINETADLVLDAAKGLTGCTHGFVASIDPVTRNVIRHTVTAIKEKECTRKDQTLVVAPGEDGVYPGLWGQALNTLQGFYTNTPSAHEKSNALLPGHLPLKSFLSVPAVFQSEPIGQISLANKEDSFTQRDLVVIKRLAALYALSVQRRQTEEALSKSEEKYRGIFDNALDMIHITDAQGHIIDANPAELKIMGYFREEYIGRKLLDIIHTDYKEITEVVFKQVLTEEKPRNYETALVTKEGKKVEVEVSVVPQFESGKIVAVQAIARNITERKTIEKLRNDHLNLEEQVNRRTAELSAAKEAAEKLNQSMAEMMVELERSRDASQKKVRELSRARRAMLNIMDDLKDARILAETANRTKSEFMSRMSHELRTPLNAILGYSQILRRRGGDFNTGQKEGLAIIQQSGEHLLILINDILDLAKIEAGRMELAPVDVHFSSFLESIVGFIHTKAELKSVKFTLLKTTPFPTWIRADEVRLRQILLNLLSNAIKYTKNGGVTLSIGIIDSEKKGWRVFRFEVVDTGVGIPSKDLEKIFLPFEQVGDRRDRVEGTGLGLAIAGQLVDLMGGRIEVDSQMGKGSIFRFDVSFQDVEVEPIEKPDDRQAIGYEGEQRKLLIADDNRNNRLMLMNMLEPLGFETIIAENGREAVAKSRESHPDLILMDLVMPVMDGFEATRIIRADPLLKNIPLIVVSADILDETREKSRLVGSDAFLSKPVLDRELFAVLESHLNLDWVYAEPRPEAQIEKKISGPLLPPPEDELTVLHKLAQIGNMRDIRIRADHIAALDKKYLPFANKLKRLAEDFEEKAILEMVEKYLVEED